MIEILKTIQTILEVNGHLGQAATVSTLIELRKSNPKDFANKLNSLDMWGGSGAVWEVNLSKQRYEFFKAFIDLVTEMRQEGLSHERADFIADTFNNWVIGKT